MTTRSGTDVDRAVALLRDGRPVAIPTETVYGLAAPIGDLHAVARVFEIKNRPSFDPLIVHVGERAAVDDLCVEIPEAARRLLARVWPGPVTVVLRKSARVDDLVTSGLPTVAVRMPGHPMTLELLRRLGEPVAAPSANPFGYVSPTRAKHVLDQLGDRVDYVLDGGDARIGLESTIVSFVESRPTVLRLGGVPVEDLAELLGESPAQRIAAHSDPEAPGQLDRHYATRTLLVVCDDVDAEAARREGQRLGLLAFADPRRGRTWAAARVLSPRGDLEEAARELFAAMRALDRAGVDVILAERFPERGLGRAINDRLGRAAARRPGDR